ncbi:hypothetical protein CBR_g40145 [Chara braunii]|uniref:Uncharacterized protein n=1 Tax=Chara braunii TaxID=69332 RepID=A0A388LT58_CHABU|nr:hypothetical protein CBR_g40145 [Chara braunii]|eukprot:GBG85506.1 hypothetical protein CBR_g40145 [Chara braunii]
MSDPVEERMNQLFGMKNGQADLLAEMQQMKRRCEELEEEKERLVTNLRTSNPGDEDAGEEQEEEQEEEDEAFCPPAHLESVTGPAADLGYHGRDRWNGVDEDDDTLRKENDLLVAQQEDLERELCRCRAEIRSRMEETVSLSGAMAALARKLRTNEKKLAELTDCLACRDKDLSKTVFENKELRKELDVNVINASAATERAEELERAFESVKRKMEADIASLRQENVCLQSREREARGAVLALSREVETLTKNWSSAKGLLEEGEAEKREMSQLVNALSEHVEEYRKKDTEAFRKLQVAVEEAEVCKLERERASAQVLKLEKEVTSLTEKLDAERKKNWKSQNASAITESSSSAAGMGMAMGPLSTNGAMGAGTITAQAVAALQEEVNRLTRTEFELSAALARALRDKKTCEQELKQVQAKASTCLQQAGAALVVDKGLVSSLGAGIPVGGVGMAAAMAARLEETERDRDTALEKATSLALTAQRSANEWESERTRLRAQLAEQEKQLKKAEKELGQTRGRATQLAHDCEELARQLQTQKRATSNAAQAVRNEAEAVRLDLEGKCKSLAERVAQLTEMHNRSMTEMAPVLAANEDLLRRMREETRNAAKVFEEATAEQRAESGRLAARVEDLSDRLQAAQARATVLDREFKIAKEEVQTLKLALEAAEKHGKDASARLAIMLESEAEWIKAKKEFQAEISRKAEAKDQVVREKELAVAECHKLRQEFRHIAKRLKGGLSSPSSPSLCSWTSRKPSGYADEVKKNKLHRESTGIVSPSSLKLGFHSHLRTESGFQRGEAEGDAKKSDYHRHHKPTQERLYRQCQRQRKEQQQEEEEKEEEEQLHVKENHRWVRREGEDIAGERQDGVGTERAGADNGDATLTNSASLGDSAELAGQLHLRRARCATQIAKQRRRTA